MSASCRRRCKAFLALAGVVLLCEIAMSVRAEDLALGRPRRDCCPPPPCLTTEAPTSLTPSVTPREGEPAVNPLAFENPDERAAARASLAYAPPTMMGDLLVPSGVCRTVIIVPPPTKPSGGGNFGHFGFGGALGFTGGTSVNGTFGVIGGQVTPPTNPTPTTQCFRVPSANHGFKIA